MTDLLARRSSPVALAMVLVLAGCAGKPKPEAVNPEREVRVLEKGDIAVRRVSFAAASYLKSISAAGDIGFRGVYFKREVDIELTRDIVTAHAFLDQSRGGGVTDRCMNQATGTRATPAPAPRDPARPGTTVAPTPAPTASCVRGAVASYGFNKFRIAYDTAYIETTGLPQGLTCMVLSVAPEGGWRVVTVKPIRPEACGK